MQQFLANLHPPSPPTTKEGQELLNVLQTSFRKQLDARHPSPFQHQRTSHNEDAIPISRESTSSHATTSYFGSVLAHPILGSLDGLHNKEDAVIKFDRMIAESRVDTTRLFSLIKWYNNKIKSPGHVADGETFGEKLNTWLHTTNSHAREDFFLDPSGLRAAIDMLASEGNESVLWKWLRMIYERDSINSDLHSESWLHVEDQLVSGIMRLAILRNDLNDAAQQFISACRYRLQSGRADPLTTPLLVSGKRLASSIIYHRYKHNISSDLFSSAMTYLPSWSSGPETSSAFCALYDPVQPSSKPLLHHLKNKSEANTLTSRQQRASRSSRKAVMTAMLDASKLSLDQGSKIQAAFFLNFAIDSYPDYLPPRQQEEVEPQLEIYLNVVPG